MTSYTIPHSLPVIEPSVDPIRSADGDNLWKQINALAQSSNSAISAEGARAALDAKIYADQRDIEHEATAVSKAGTYTDSREAVMRDEFATSNLAIDSDGTPYIRYGSQTAKLLQDADGTPYYEAA